MKGKVRGEGEDLEGRARAKQVQEERRPAPRYQSKYLHGEAGQEAGDEWPG